MVSPGVALSIAAWMVVKLPWPFASTIIGLPAADTPESSIKLSNTSQPVKVDTSNSNIVNHVFWNFQMSLKISLILSPHILCASSIFNSINDDLIII